MITGQNFRDKYTKPGRIGNVLVNRFYGAIEELVLGHASKADTVLEIGVGEGFSTQKIRAMLPRDINLEVSEFDSDLARLAQQRNPDVRVSQESIYQLNRETASFDLVICLEVLEHLTDPSAALSELARVSRRYVMVSVPREPLWRALNLLRGKYFRHLGNTPGHIQHWSVRGFCQLVRPLFHVLEVRKPLPWTILLLQKKT
ncbi:MAG: class I SAM-dependent methyltransferase [Sulfuricaulis sp.]